MDPTQEEKQEQKEGPISQGINIINNIPRGGFRNPISSGVATKALAAIPPWIWIVLGIVILLIVVSVIVGSGVGPGAPSQQAITPTLGP